MIVFSSTGDMGVGKRRVPSGKAAGNAAANMDGEAAQGGGSRKRQKRGMVDGVAEFAPVTMCLTMQCDRRQLAGKQTVVNEKVKDAARKVMVKFEAQNVEMAWSRVGESVVEREAQCFCCQDPCACKRWREDLQAKGFCITTVDGERLGQKALSRLNASPGNAASPSSSNQKNEEHMGENSGMQEEAATEHSEEVVTPPSPQLSSPSILPRPGAARRAWADSHVNHEIVFRSPPGPQIKFLAPLTPYYLRPCSIFEPHNMPPTLRTQRPPADETTFLIKSLNHKTLSLHS